MANEDIVRLRLEELKLCHPRQWGACWLALHLRRELGLDQFWAQGLTASRKGTRWDLVLAVLTCYRLLSPGSEWRLHREWFLRSALADLLGRDFSLAEEHRLYECHDKLLAHKAAPYLPRAVLRVSRSCGFPWQSEDQFVPTLERGGLPWERLKPFSRLRTDQTERPSFRWLGKRDGAESAYEDNENGK